MRLALYYRYLILSLILYFTISYGDYSTIVTYSKPNLTKFITNG